MEGADKKPTEVKKKPKPMLKLNTGQKAFEDKDILILQNSTNSYVIQNHPIITDLTESASANKHKLGSFFNQKNSSEPYGDYSYSGDYYYVVQKSNGKEMQDRYKARTITEYKNMAFFAVYDGHSTQVIAQLLTDKLDDYFFEEYKGSQNMDGSIQKAFLRIEQEVIAQLEEAKPRGGSTALCSFLNNDQLHIANLGDSQAVVFQEEKFIELSNLHDFKNEQERLYAEEKGGTVINNRLEGELAVSRSIGDIKFKSYMNSEPEIASHQMTEKDDFLFLASDGFWNGLSPESCLQSIKKLNIKKSNPLDLKFIGDLLIEEACRNVKTKKDNMTLIIISIKDYFEKRHKN
jgi:serine/threonine protein phosphatase PrpC